MERIASFEIDHRILKRGMYISRIDGDITTYDLRTRRPNVEPVMENAALHTVEHLFATYARNSEYGDKVIYFGPMGCRTGFYFLTRNLDNKRAIELVKAAFDFIISFEGEVPGTREEECGNYREHDLEGAKEEARMMKEVLKDWDEASLTYPK